MDQYLIRKNTGRGGFTIIELLVVIAIIAILSGIFFGVADGVRDRSRISRAETELSLLAQYLEQYKAHYGDYPHVTFADSDSADSATKREGEDGIAALYDALNGFRTVDGTQLTARERAFIDRSKLDSLFLPSKDPVTPADPEVASAALIDPWGRAYRYYYDKGSAGWENNRFVLYSVGESGVHVEPNAKGYPEKTDPDNLDNIYAN